MVTLYEYRAQVRAVTDGDTVRLDVDAGFGLVLTNEPFRLYGIDAPERKTETLGAGNQSRDRLAERVLGRIVSIRTLKPTREHWPSRERQEKYGRYLVVIWDDQGCVNDWMVEEGLARPYLP